MTELSLPDLIRGRIQELKMTDAQYARHIGLTRQTMSSILRGVTALPEIETRRRLAADIGVHHVDLLVSAGELSLEEAAEGPTKGVPTVASDPVAVIVRRIRALPAADLTDLETFVGYLEQRAFVHGDTAE